MIKILNLKIDSTSRKIDVEVEAEANNTISGVYFYDKDTYEDITKAIDLSSKIDGTDNTESFTILAEDVDLEYFDELYFIYFEATENSEECDVVNNTETGVIGNFTNFHNCILDKISYITVKQCDIYYKGEICEDCLEKLFSINTLLNSLYTALEFYMFEEAVDIYNNIKLLCYDCTCFSDNTTLNIAGVFTEDCEVECGLSNKVTKYPCL